MSKTFGHEEVQAAGQLQEKVSAECIRLATALSANGLGAVNDARLLLCRHELERYKPFSVKYRAGDCSLMEALLSRPIDSGLDVAQVDAALDAMEADFDDWSDELSSDACRAILNIAENLVELHHDPVAALARGMECWILALLDDIYFAELGRGGSVIALVDEYMSGRDIPGLDFVADICRTARSVATPRQ